MQTTKKMIGLFILVLSVLGTLPLVLGGGFQDPPEGEEYSPYWCNYNIPKGTMDVRYPNMNTYYSYQAKKLAGSTSDLAVYDGNYMKFSTVMRFRVVPMIPPLIMLDEYCIMDFYFDCDEAVDNLAIRCYIEGNVLENWNAKLHIYYEDSTYEWQGWSGQHNTWYYNSWGLDNCKKIDYIRFEYIYNVLSWRFDDVKIDMLKCWND